MSIWLEAGQMLLCVAGWVVEIKQRFFMGRARAYGSVVERGIRIAETAVRFCLSPQKQVFTCFLVCKNVSRETFGGKAVY